LIILSNYGFSQANYDTLKTNDDKVTLALDRYLAADIIAAEVDKAFIKKDYSLVKQKSELLFAKYPEYVRTGVYKNLLKDIEQIEADIIGAEVDKAFIEKDYSLVKQKLELLFAQYPEYHRKGEYKTLLKTIEQIKIDEVKIIEAVKQEQYRLANINNLGIWSIHPPVNQYGVSNKKRYITNTKLIRGTFNNSKTQDAKLNVKFLISDSSKISIQLFEHAGSMPLKAWSDHSYIIFVQDDDGNSYKIEAVNISDKLELNKIASIQLHHILLNGGNVKMKIHEYYNSGNNYHFSIQKVDWYENAYRVLTNP